MRKVLYLIIALLFISCEDSVISDGRKAYKQYFKNTLKDPESLKIYSETASKTGDNTATFIVDYGAKNSFGAYVRETVTFETMHNRVVKVDGNTYSESSNTTKTTSMELTPLALKKGLYGTSYINRGLLVYNENSDFIKISPSVRSGEDGVYLIVESSLKDNGYGTRLTLKFLYGENNLSLKANTEINENKSLSYYDLTKGQIEILRDNKLREVLIEKSGNSFYCNVDNNQQTYFKEYFGLKEIEQVVQAIKP